MIRHVSDVAEAGAELLVQEGRNSLAARGRFVLVLSGGSTPLNMYRYLTEHHAEEAFWPHTHVYWGDERYVPHDHQDSNYGAAKRELLDHLPVPKEQIHPWPFYEGEPQKAADELAAKIKAQFDAAPFDLNLLGLGDDAHTASLFPGTGAALATGTVTVVTPAGKGTRLSMTLETLSHSRVVAFLVAGENKREALERTLQAGDSADPDTLPAACVHALDELLWLTDLEVAP